MGRPKKIHIDPDQPSCVCYRCGVMYGSFKAGLATWYKDTCGVCGETHSCTEPRDFGYLLLGWKELRGDNNVGRDVDEVESS